jgi:hypothetical protein
MWIGVLSGIHVHSDCKNLASKLIHCPPLLSHDVGMVDHTNTVFGTVTVKMLQAYDLSFAPPGTALYGLFHLKGDNSIIKRTIEAVSGDNDCVWDTAATQLLSEDRDCTLPVTGFVAAASCVRLC